MPLRAPEMSNHRFVGQCVTVSHTTKHPFTYKSCVRVHGRVPLQSATDKVMPLFSPQLPSWRRRPSSTTPTTPARSWWPQTPLEWGSICEFTQFAICWKWPRSFSQPDVCGLAFVSFAWVLGSTLAQCAVCCTVQNV